MASNDESDRVGYLLPFLDGNSYLFGVGVTPRTRIDMAMSYLSASLRRKPEWWLNYKDEATRALWLQDARELRYGQTYEFHLSEKQISYILDELEGYATLRQNDTGIQISCYDRIWETDSLLGREERIILDDAVIWLRQQHHERSSPLLVDPCRHAIIFSRTRTKTGTLVEKPGANDYSVSTSFASLPTDVGLPRDGKSTTILSYINGIDPHFSKVYAELGKLLSRAVILFEKVLTDLHRNNPMRQRITGTYSYAEWDEPDPPEDSDDEDGWEIYDKEMARWIETRPVVLPDVPDEGFHDDLTARKHVVCLGGRDIQVIFKIIDLALDSAKPHVNLNTEWHVEGMKNERIVACVHYYSCLDNIDAGNIEFRMAVSSGVKARSDDVGASYRTWELRDGDECNQYLGFVPIQEGLAIALPNLYQQKHSTIELIDKRKSGRFSLISLFLVDPDAQPIVSTSTVAPQQRDWILGELIRSMDKRFPTELLVRVVDEVEGLLTNEEADKYQEKMTREREQFHNTNNERYFALPFHCLNLHA